MGKLLDSLGLSSPGVGRLPPAQTADGRKVDLNLPPDYIEKQEQAKAPKPKVDFKLPSDPKQQVDVFAQALEKTTDAVQRDKLVRGLRDQIAKIPQPFLKPDEVKKKLDDAIKSLIESKSKELLLQLIEAAVGQKAQKVDPDAKPSYGPRVEEKDLGEKILKIPLPFPGDAPKKPVQGSFEFRGLPRSARPSSYVSFKLRTPHWWDAGKYPGSYVVSIDAAAYDKDAAGAAVADDTRIETSGELSLSVRMPDAPGSAVLAIKIQGVLEGHPVERIELKG